MIAKKESEERCMVSVTRVKPQQLAVAEPNPLACLPILAVGLDLSGSSALSTRRGAEVSRPRSTKASLLPQVCIRLDEGTVHFNGKKVGIPLGLTGPVTGKELKKIAGIYPGNLLFVRTNGGMQRIRDNQSIELVEGTEFRHERPAPAFSSMSSLSRD